MAEPTETTPLLNNEPQIQPQHPRQRSRPGLITWLLAVVFIVGINQGLNFIAPLYLDKYVLTRPFPLTLRAAAILLNVLASIITTPFWTALGDKVGRRPILLLSMTAALLPNLALIAVERVGLHHAFYLVGVLGAGLLGGFTTFTAVAHAYGADFISAKSRFGLFSVLHGLFALTNFAPDIFTANLAMFPERNLTRFTNDLVHNSFIVLAVAIFFALLFLPEPPTTRHSGLGLKIWIPSPPFRRSSFIGLALFFYSFTTASFLAFRNMFGEKRPWYHLPREGREDYVFSMQLMRYFVGIPLTVSIRSGTSPLSPIRLDHSFATFSVLLHTLSSAGAAIVSTVIFEVIRQPDLFFALTMFLVLTIFTVAAIPAIYSLAAGYYQETGRQGEWGLLLGRLSIMQAVSTGVVGVLEESFGDNLYGVYQLYFVTTVCQALAFALLWQFPRGSRHQSGGDQAVQE